MSKNMSTAAAQTAPRHGLQNVRTLVSCALLAAVSVVLARFIIPMPNETTRFSLEAVPIFLAGMLFGPLPGALVGFVADFVGCLFSGYGYNPMLCVPPILYGLAAGQIRKEIRNIKKGSIMTLDEALYYIHSVCWKGSVPGLERISALLDKMGHPERKLKFIHVTGTNGKGSTCAMLASMFTKAGYKTGLYTSPFLIRFNERIQIDGVQISDEEICRITEYIKPLADSIFEQPTEFEMVTALGFEYFARQGCDLVVCEVGMGGEFDATNVILPPEAAVICNIGLDHTEVLGDTLEKIAATKSGIIKPGCDAVIYREQPSVEAVIEDRCKAVGAKLHKADFADIHLLSHDLTGQVFDWERFKRLKLPLLGDHQLHNAAVALTTATVMQQRGWKLTDDDIREGLASVRWPGRFDVRRSDPLFIIDGGHNPQCIQALVKNIQNYLPGRPLTILTGVLADKDYNCMYRNVEPYAKEFITITPGNPRALNAHDLAAYLSQFGKPVTACDQVADGVRLAVEHAGKDGVVLCYGSLYMIGEIEAGLAQL